MLYKLFLFSPCLVIPILFINCNNYNIFVFSRTVGVLGAGLMGAGIAHVTVDKGLQVVLKDTNKEGLARGVGQIEKGLSGAVKRKKMTA